MKTYNIALLAAVAAASAPTNGTTLTMRSTTNSKIKMGNAVFAGYCQGDVAPTFNGIDLDATRLHPDGVSLMPGIDHTITLTLLNVKASCLGNNGVAPCADDAGQARAIDTQFVCKFHSPSFLSSYLAQGDDASRPVQAERITEAYAGEQYVSTKVTCVLPRRANIEHDLVVSLEYHGKQVVQLPYVGRQGGDTIPIGATATPTQYPTAAPTMAPTAPTAFPTAAPTKAPTTAAPTKAPTKAPTAYPDPWVWGTSTWVQEGDDIDGDTSCCGSNGVSMSADGKTFAFGRNTASGSGHHAGHVRVYGWNGQAWVQKGADIDGEAAGDTSGYAVSMSDDGDTVAIGAHHNHGVNGAYSGHVRVYNWNGQAWVQKGADIDGEAYDDRSGITLSMSADGTVVAIGAPYHDDDRTGAAYKGFYADGGGNALEGHVRVFRWNGQDWVQKGADIDGEAEGDQSGGSVSMSADGATVAIGAWLNGGGNAWGHFSGHVRVYSWDSQAWVQKGSDIDGEAANDRSGHSVSISADGDTVAIGAPGNDGNGQKSGHVRIYGWNGQAWAQKGTDIDGEAADDNAGRVSMSADGATVLIGARSNDGNGHKSGHVRIYGWNGQAWVQKGADIDGEAANDRSGDAVSISADGSTVAIAAPMNNGDGDRAGHVRVYTVV